MIWPRPKVICFSKGDSTGDSTKKKKKTYTEEEGGRILQSGQKRALPAQLGQQKTGQGGKRLLRTHLWCPDDHSRLWNRIEIYRLVNFTKFNVFIASL